MRQRNLLKSLDINLLWTLDFFICSMEGGNHCHLPALALGGYGIGVLERYGSMCVRGKLRGHAEIWFLMR